MEKKIPIPELLAPAGNFEALYSALENGADAVYLGLKKFSARGFAKNFDIDEIPFILEYAKSGGKKVYITLNTVFKEVEIREVFYILESLAKFGVNGVIFQDFGVIKLVKKYFPELNLHASTQLTNLNSFDVLFLSRYVKRVVLERQVFLDEIKKIIEKSPVEIECFIHGALCYSISGRCLFSSYLGGKSGNRGLCTQPCRRMYFLKNSRGYYFSPNDLEAVNVFEDLLKLGINAFKIEGRMKSASYVGNVVKAYRILLDEFYKKGKISDEAKVEAKSYIKDSFGRKTCYAFFKKPISNVVEPKLSGNTGLFIGKTLEKSDRFLKFKTLSSIEIFDRIRVQSLREDEKRLTFKVKEIFDVRMKPLKKAEKNRVILIPLPKKFELKKGDLVFKVQSIKSKVKLKDEESVKRMIKSYKPLIPVSIEGEFREGALIFNFKGEIIEVECERFYPAEKSELTSEVLKKYFSSKFSKRGLELENLSFEPVKIVIPQKELKKAGDFVSEKVKEIVESHKVEPETELKEIVRIPPERFFYFKMPSVYDILMFPDDFSDSIILPVHPHIEEIYLKYSKKFEKLKDRILFCIDDVLTEDKLSFYRDKIEFLKGKGFYKFYLNSKAEFEFFRDDLQYFLVASENFHVANTISMEFLKEEGFSKIVLDIENDEKNLRKFFFKIDAIVPLFSYVRLMISRIPNTIEKSSILKDYRKKESFYFKVKKDFYELIHTEPFSISNHIEEIYNMGYRNFLIDISQYLKYKQNFKGLISNFKKGISPVRGRDFNYSHGWS